MRLCVPGKVLADEVDGGQADARLQQQVHEADQRHQPHAGSAARPTEGHRGAPQGQERSVSTLEGG